MRHREVVVHHAPPKHFLFRTSRSARSPPNTSIKPSLSMCQRQRPMPSPTISALARASKLTRKSRARSRAKLNRKVCLTYLTTQPRPVSHRTTPHQGLVSIDTTNTDFGIYWAYGRVVKSGPYFETDRGKAVVRDCNLRPVSTPPLQGVAEQVTRVARGRMMSAGFNVEGRD